MMTITVKNLNKKFGSRPVISGLTFSCSSPVLGVAGTNGSGKSTLLRCLAGLLKPTSGTIQWKLNDEPITPKNLKKYLGYVAPYIQLYEELTAKENLQFLAKLKNIRGDTRTHELLDLFKIRSLENSPFGNLSTGQQQRVKLASAIIHNPELLMLDEPGSNLDSAGKKAVNELVSEYRDSGRMVIIASNQKDELDLCDDVLSLNQTVQENLNINE